MSPSVTITHGASTCGSSASVSMAGDEIAAAVAADLGSRRVRPATAARRTSPRCRTARGGSDRPPPRRRNRRSRRARAGSRSVIEPLVSSTTLSIQPSRLRPGSTTSARSAPRRDGRDEGALARRDRFHPALQRSSPTACGTARAARVTTLMSRARVVAAPALHARPSPRPAQAPCAASSSHRASRARPAPPRRPGTSRARSCRRARRRRRLSCSAAARLAARRRTAAARVTCSPSNTRGLRRHHARRSCRISSTISSADLLARARHVEPAGRDRGEAQLDAQDVVDDVVVRVVELEPAAAARRDRACAAPDAAARAPARRPARCP